MGEVGKTGGLIREAMELTNQGERRQEAAKLSQVIRNVLLSACHPRREIWAEADSAFRIVKGNTATKSQHSKNRGANKDSFGFPIVPFQCLSAPQHFFQVL
jgi:hypothetical protein